MLYSRLETTFGILNFAFLRRSVHSVTNGTLRKGKVFVNSQQIFSRIFTEVIIYAT